MSNRRVPVVAPRSKAGIERDAVGFLARHAPDCLTDPRPVPVERLLDPILGKYHRVDFAVRQLDYPCEAVTEPGTGGAIAVITLDSAVFDLLGSNNGRARFTAAHEIYHALHHMQELQTRLEHSNQVSLYRRADVPAYLDPEWQANAFASRLLMPETAVRLAVRSIHGPFRVDVVAETFQVSKRAAAIRLEEIGLG